VPEGRSGQHARLLSGLANRDAFWPALLDQAERCLDQRLAEVPMMVAPTPRSLGRRSFQVCPVVGGGLGFGPNNIEGSGIDLSTRGADVGLSVGASMLESPIFDLVPFAGLSLVFGSATLRAGDGSSLTDSQTYGSADIGVGLVISRILTLKPSVSIPFGLQGADASFGVGLSLHLSPRL
jgi:hypothetical protein